MKLFFDGTLYTDLYLYHFDNTPCTVTSDGVNRQLLNFDPLNAELNAICHLLALLGGHHILHISGLRVKYCYRIEIGNMSRRITNKSNKKLIPPA
jgi:hypothetical protein